MSHDPVDVLIIGAGASGAAIAWSLVETRMRILCLEQGPASARQGFPKPKRRLRTRPLRLVQLRSQRQAASAGLPDQRRGFGDFSGQLQRRRRFDHQFLGALAALSSFGFSREVVGRRRRRLADRLRHARALLRHERPQHRRFRVWPATPPTRPTSRLCLPFRSASSAKPLPRVSTSSAGTGGRPMSPS